MAVQSTTCGTLTRLCPIILKAEGSALNLRFVLFFSEPLSVREKKLLRCDALYRSMTKMRAEKDTGLSVQYPLSLPDFNQKRKVSKKISVNIPDIKFNYAS